MTYFEWVDTFRILKDSPMDDKILDNLRNKKLDGGEYVLIRLARHISLTNKYRLENALYNLLNNIVKANLDLDVLSLELVGMKKEISFVRKIIDLPIVNLEDVKKLLIDNVNYSVEYIYNFLKDELSFIDDPKLYSLLEDCKKMWWED